MEFLIFTAGVSQTLQELWSSLTFWAVSVPVFGFAVFAFLNRFKVNVGTPFFAFIKKMSTGLDKIDSLEKKVNAVDEKVNSVISTQQEVAAERLMEFQVNSTPMYECDQDGNNIRVNRAYCELFSLSDPKQAERYNWTQYIDEKERLQYVAEWRRCIETISVFRYKATFIDTDGNVIGKLESRAWPMFTVDNKFLKYRGYLDFCD
jgi:PAS domain-containing protein